jgi:hypothetical protein
MGSTKVVTIESIGHVCYIQPGDRKWITAIEYGDIVCRDIPPMIILDGRIHLEYWYQ